MHGLWSGRAFVLHGIISMCCCDDPYNPPEAVLDTSKSPGPLIYPCHSHRRIVEIPRQRQATYYFVVELCLLPESSCTV